MREKGIGNEAQDVALACMDVFYYNGIHCNSTCSGINHAALKPKKPDIATKR